MSDMETVTGLSRRELEFLALAGNGFTRNKIAQAFCVSPMTVKHTFARARARTGAASTAHCVVLAIAREQLILDHEGVVHVPRVMIRVLSAA
jgi:DNA-binding CsgD family transcriptional regulator